MRQWHCIVNGQQYGPISEEQIRAWIAERRIGPSDTVWTEGMGAWAPAASVPELIGPGVTSGLEGRTPVPPPGGSGGRTGACELVRRAWAGMEGRWGIAIGFWLLFVLLQNASGAIPYIGPIIFLFVFAGPFALGSAIFFLTYVRGGRAEIGMLFAGFKNWGTSVGTFLLVYLFTLGWMLLGVLPGVVAGSLAGAYAEEPEVGLAIGLIAGGVGMMAMGVYAGLRYSQAMFLLADNPALTAMEAVAGAVRIIRGHKLRLFRLFLLFALAQLACLLLICVGWVLFLIFGAPVILATQALFYDDLQPPRAEPDRLASPPGAPQLPPS